MYQEPQKCQYPLTSWIYYENFTGASCKDLARNIFIAVVFVIAKQNWNRLESCINNLLNESVNYGIAIKNSVFKYLMSWGKDQDVIRRKAQHTTLYQSHR